MNRMKRLIVAAFLVWMPLLGFAQKRTITGTVYDNENSPLAGAGVVFEKDPTKGVVTDIDGIFRLDALEGDVLVISFFGFADQKITVGEQSEITVTLLPDTTTLDEIVVIGYGTTTSDCYVDDISIREIIKAEAQK